MENGKEKWISDDREEEAYPGYARKIPVKVIYKYSKSICKLTIEGNNILGTGFFMCLYDKQKKMNCLITNYHVISQNLIDSKKDISIQLENKIQRKIKLDAEKRFIKCFKKPKDITIIEIIDNDDIVNMDILFLSYDLNYLSGYSQYHNADIFILQHPLGKETEFAPGKITVIKGYEFKHSAETDSGSSGSPVILYGNYEVLKVIGIHKEYDKKDNHGIGTFIGEIGEFFKKENLTEEEISEDSMNLNNERIEQNLSLYNISIFKEKYNKCEKNELININDDNNDIIVSKINEYEYSDYKSNNEENETKIRKKITLISNHQAELIESEKERENKIYDVNSK